MWSGLTNLVTLDLSSAGLFGAFFTPQFFAAGLTALEELRFYQNGINDTLPTSLGLLKSLTEISIFNNALYGTLATERELIPLFLFLWPAHPPALQYPLVFFVTSFFPPTPAPHPQTRKFQLASYLC